MKKRILSFLLALCLTVTMLPIMVSATADVTVNTFDELKNVLTTDGTMIIEIASDITVTETITVNGSAKVKTLVSNGNYTLTKGTGVNSMIVISGGAKLNVGIKDSSEFTGSLIFDGANVIPTLTEGGSLICSTGAGSAVTVNNGIFQNNISASSYDGAVSAKSKGALNLYGGTITKNAKKLTTETGAGVAAYGTDSTVTIDGAEITNNNADGGGAAISAVSTSTINLESGLITGNTGINSVRIGTNCKFTMNGGTIEGINSTDYATILIEGTATVIINGGTIQNTGTAIRVHSSGSTLTFGSLVGGNGVVMNNCNGTYGGCINVNAASTINVNAGTFKNSSGFLRMKTGSTTIANLFGGRIENCGVTAVWLEAGTLNVGNSISFDDKSIISLRSATEKVNIDKNLTINGAVAKVKRDTGTDVSWLSGTTTQLLTDNAGKFVAPNGTSSFNASGVVDDSKAALGFIWPQGGTQTPELRLSFLNGTATATANYNVGNAVLIVASYNGSYLTSAEKFDVTINNNSITETVSGEFIYGSEIKVMLWDSTVNIKPLVAAYVNP